MNPSAIGMSVINMVTELVKMNERQNAALIEYYKRFGAIPGVFEPQAPQSEAPMPTPAPAPIPVVKKVEKAIKK